MDIWMQRIAGEGPPTPALTEILTDDIHARARAFLRPALGNAFLHSRIFERLVLARYLDCPPAELQIVRTCRLCGGPHGKPRLAGVPGRYDGARLDFSLSHADGIVVAAVVGSASQVGIDVEHVHTASTMPKLVESVCSPEEIAADDRHPLTVLAHWVRKEALLKATGHGLAIAPAKVTLRFEAANIWRVVDAPHLTEREAWHIIDLDLGPAHLGAAALDSDIDEVSVTVLEGV